MRKMFLLAIVGVLLLALTGLAADLKTIRVSQDVDADTLDPRLTTNTTAYRACDLIYDSLVTQDENLQLQPLLATSWETEDSLVWVFHLRTDVTFSDGEPLTAADVVFTYETMTDPDFNSPYRSLVNPIVAIEALDDYTVQMTLEQPYAPLFSYLDTGIVPEHIAATNPEQLYANPVGSGPYTLANWDKGSIINLVAREDYWGGAPNLNIDIVIVPDPTARAQALEAGDIDLVMSPLAPQDVVRLGRDPNIAGFELAGLGVTYLNFNVQDPILSDVRVRQAISMLVDAETIGGFIYQGMDTPATSMLLPNWPAYTDAVAQPTFTIEGAKALLAVAGWADTNNDGVLDKDGQDLSFVLSTHSEDPNRVQAVEYLQYLFSEVGIDCTANISDWPSFFATVLAGEHDIALLGWLNLNDPDRMFHRTLHSAGANNWAKYSNAAYDAAVETGRTVLDEAARTEAYQTAAGIIATELPYYIILYQGYQVYFTPKLIGYAPHVRGLMRNLTTCTLED
jgi:peptide/nickel transport system substrate-binding protein